jgi:hypothetical protein
MIPVVDDLKSSPMVHRFGDLFNPPGLTNFLGCVQADIDITGIRSLNFPPFACSDTVTANLYIDRKFFPSTGSPVTFTWYPDRIDRSSTVDGLELNTTTALAVGKTAALVQVRITNRRSSDAEVELKLAFRGGVTKAVRPWTDALPPTEADNAIDIDHDRCALRFTARNSSACSLQGIYPLAQQATPNGLRFTLRLRPGETREFSYVNVIAETRGDVESLYDSLIRRVPEEIAAARDEWNAELRAVFTPGNDRYSGFMPTLHTSDADIRKLYLIGILGVIYFKRDTPHSVHGRAYTTLVPRYWQPVTFLWDYSLSSLVHALLDPAVMRNNLDRWMHLDIHAHFGTEYLTGAGVGPWYSVNDYAMTSIAHDYRRWTGDQAWLDREIGRNGTCHRPVHYLEKYATNFHRFRTPHGLADYGGLNNLLECVDSYLHEVASLNAANVFNLRTWAAVLTMRGDHAAAERIRAEASALAQQVMKLYADGRGFWHARFPDGSLREVRHAYDFLTILNTIPQDLSDRQKSEMTDFFRRELQTPNWLHALSCDDDNAGFSVRPDHQWTGAYPAWPPMCATGLYRIGQSDLGFDWLKGLSKSANQGPFGQAHFAESVVSPEDGGSRKAPPDWPYITDWTCSSNGAWANVIIESIFGVRATLADGIDAAPQFGPFDPSATLENLPYQGHRYTATRKGLRRQD